MKPTIESRVAYLSWLASHHGAKADIGDAISAFTISAVLLEAFYETTDTDGECVRLTVRGAKWLAENDPAPAEAGRAP